MSETLGLWTPENPLFNAETFSYKGSEIRYQGINHGFFDPYEAKFKEEFADADIIIPEFAPVALGYMTPEGNLTDEYVQKFVEANKGYTWTTAKRSLQVSEDAKVYARIEKLAHEMGKGIVVIDPESDAPDEIAGRKRLREMDDQEILLGKLATTAVAGAGALGLDVSLAKDVVQKRNRRAFFKFMGASALAGLAMGTLPIEDLYDRNDYREVAVSHVLATKADAGHLPGRIKMPYGDFHKAAIKHYLANPGKREGKFAAYAPLRAVAPPRWREFRPAGKGWEQVKNEVVK